jgi:hypothetical protein
VDKKRSEAVLAHVPLDHLVKLLSSKNEKILTPALRILAILLLATMIKRIESFNAVFCHIYAKCFFTPNKTFATKLAGLCAT